MGYSLREYQVTAIQKIRAEYQDKKRRVLLVSPTGSGKTVTSAELVRLEVNCGNRVLFVAHRKEIIDQTSEKLDSFGVEHGVVMANHWRRFDHHPVQVASIQTLSRRRMPRADLVIIDEAQHATAAIYRKMINSYPDASIVGLTATPWRSGGKGLGDVFDSIIVAATPAKLIAQGHLVSYGGFSFQRPDLNSVRLRRGDYDERQLELACNKTQIVGGIVEKWLEHANGLRTIAFATGVDHSKNIVERFRAAGVAVEHLDGRTPKTEREAILASLENGSTRVISNVGVLTEGWDCPSAVCCILARPTKSLGLYLQMVGRVMRPYPGKSRALIHDHAGCLLEHGLPDEPRNYSLDALRSKSDSQKIVQCQQCYRVFPRSESNCPECGWKNQSASLSSTNDKHITEIQGRLIGVDELKRIRNIPDRIKASEYKRLLRIAQYKGYKIGWAAHQYKATFGVWPRISPDLLRQVIPTARPINLSHLRKIHARGEVNA